MSAVRRVRRVAGAGGALLDRSLLRTVPATLPSRLPTPPAVARLHALAVRLGDLQTPLDGVGAALRTATRSDHGAAPGTVGARPSSAASAVRGATASSPGRPGGALPWPAGTAAAHPGDDGRALDAPVPWVAADPWTLPRPEPAPPGETWWPAPDPTVTDAEAPHPTVTDRTATDPPATTPPSSPASAAAPAGHPRPVGSADRPGPLAGAPDAAADPPPPAQAWAVPGPSGPDAHAGVTDGLVGLVNRWRAATQTSGGEPSGVHPARQRGAAVATPVPAGEARSGAHGGVPDVSARGTPVVASAPEPVLVPGDLPGGSGLDPSLSRAAVEERLEQLLDDLVRREALANGLEDVS